MQLKQLCAFIRQDHPDRSTALSAASRSSGLTCTEYNASSSCTTMAIHWTLSFVSVFALLITGGYGWFTYCSPEVDYFENIQNLLESSATRYGVYYSSYKKDTHPTVEQILDRLNVDLTKQISSKQSIEAYTAAKLNQYGVSRAGGTGSAIEVQSLKEIFRQLDAENDLVLRELEQHRSEYATKQQEHNRLLNKIQALRDVNVTLETSIKERNNTLSKALATKAALQKTVLERGLD